MAAAGHAQVTEIANGNTVVRGALGARLDEFLRGLTRDRFAGVVLVAKDGSLILHKGYGWADRDSIKPNTTETIFEIASLAKQFTAAAILKLEEQGRLRVTDSIRDHLPGVPDDKAGITLHQLLTHTAGLPRETTEDSEVLSREELVRRILGAELRFPPGTRREYSNPGYMLLAIIVEVVSGNRYSDFLHDQLFEPAGLAGTGFAIPDSSRAAHPYRYADYWATLPQIPKGSYWHRHGAGGLRSNPGDLYRWLLALQGRDLLSAASTRKLFAPHVRLSERSRSSYGYGWVITPTRRGTRMIWHNGGWYGFYSELNWYVDEEVVAILSTEANRDGFVETYWEPLLDMLFENPEDERP